MSESSIIWFGSSSILPGTLFTNCRLPGACPNMRVSEKE